MKIAQETLAETLKGQTITAVQSAPAGTLLYLSDGSLVTVTSARGQGLEWAVSKVLSLLKDKPNHEPL
jgi:hypothetical protein